VPLQEGLVDWPRVLRALADRRYEGSLVIDHLSAPEMGEQVAEEHRTLRGLLDEVALRR
jgi:sugar phosphate isomerase/epimerase